VLRAFSLIQRRFPDAALTVAGEGSMRRELESIAQQLDLKNVVFAGRVRFEELPALCDAADVYLNAPNLDNMPASLIECFASGLPVVTTNAGGVPYIVSHEQTGLLVACGDQDAMASAAIRLLKDQELASQIARQAREACRRYTWDAVRDEWLQVYRELAAGQAASPQRLGAPRRAPERH
jgi:glycosyltransferase involved in cell wall biosynthesis